MCKRGRKDHDVCQTVFMLLLLPAASATSCQQLQCLNSNPCQSHLTSDNTTHAQCLCGGKWAGPRCEFHLHLQTETVTSSSVTLTVDVMTSQKHETKTNPLWKETAKLPPSEGAKLPPSEDAKLPPSEDAKSEDAKLPPSEDAKSEDAKLPPSEDAKLPPSEDAKLPPSEDAKLPGWEEKLWLNYTLAYWRKTTHDTSSSNASHQSFQPSEKTSCVILHRQTSQHPTLQGLHPQAWYAVCVESGFRDSCILSSITDPFPSSAPISPSWDWSPSSWPPNCVTFVTTSRRETTEDVSSLIVGTVVVVVCVVCIVSIGVFLIRRHYSVARRFFTGPICQQRCRRSRTYRYNSPEDWACLNPSHSQQETSALVDRTDPHHRTDQWL